MKTCCGLRHVAVTALVFVVAFLVTPTQATTSLLWNYLLRNTWLGEIFGPPQYGDYLVAKADYYLPSVLDPSYPWAVLVFPKRVLWPGNNDRFPLVVFSHGDSGGGILTFVGHTALLNGIASFGFIVVAPASCNDECSNGGSETYQEEQLKLIEWASEESRDEDVFDILKSVDRENGYGLFGHSKGGTAIVGASPQFEDYNVTAAVLLHPGEDPPGIYDSSVPLAAFTGTLDDCCGEETTKPYYEQASPAPRAYANMIGALHTEPVLFWTRWTAYVAAWFKIWLTESDDPFYYDLIYGDRYVSLCGGKFPMKDDCDALV